MLAITLPPTIVVLMLGLIISLVGIIYARIERRLEAVEEDTDENNKFRYRNQDD